MHKYFMKWETRKPIRTDVSSEDIQLIFISKKTDWFLVGGYTFKDYSHWCKPPISWVAFPENWESLIATPQEYLNKKGRVKCEACNFGLCSEDLGVCSMCKTVRPSMKERKEKQDAKNEIEASNENFINVSKELQKIIKERDIWKKDCETLISRCRAYEIFILEMARRKNT